MYLTATAVGGSRVFAFTVPGEPVPKARPRATTIGGHARLYTPKKTRSFEDRVRQAAMIRWDGLPIRECAIELIACFYLPIPRSWSKKRQVAAAAGTIRPTSKPDLDNLIKSITDGLNGVVYQDDAAIVETRNAKFYGADPRIEVTLIWSPAT